MFKNLMQKSKLRHIILIRTALNDTLTLVVDIWQIIYGNEDKSACLVSVMDQVNFHDYRHACSHGKASITMSKVNRSCQLLDGARVNLQATYPIVFFERFEKSQFLVYRATLHGQLQ